MHPTCTTQDESWLGAERGFTLIELVVVVLVLSVVVGMTATLTLKPLEAYGEVADTLMVCLSKGLCAPVGSVLVGDEDLIAKARDVRKMLGGGMRQVGVLAAPGLIAVREMRGRLADDHRRARALAEGLVAAGGVTLPYGAMDTNIVVVRLEGRDAHAVQTHLAAHGVQAIAFGSDRMRFVTHHDVGDDDVERALAAFASSPAAA